MHFNLSLLPIALLLMAVSAALAGADSTLPCPGSPAPDLWVLAGQSNMQGHGLITRKYKADSRIMMLGMDSKWIPAVPPTHRILDEAAAPVFRNIILASPAFTEESYRNAVEMSKKNPIGGMGPDYFFAQHIVKHTGGRVGLIPCAMGGTSMAQWDPAAKSQGGDSLYGNMMQRIALAGGKIKGILWYQGESEAVPGEVSLGFEKAFLNLVDSIRRDTGIPDLPFIYVQISRYYLDSPDLSDGWEVVRETQRTAVGKRKNLFVVPAIDLPLDDFIHIGTAGQGRLGVRLAQVALDRVYNRKDGATAIDYDSFEILPKLGDLHNRLRVRFTGVNGKLQSKGDATGFSLRSGDAPKEAPCVFKVEFDPKDPASVIVWYSKPIAEPVQLYYGAGMHPYVNIVDSKDMAVPAFGPITIAPGSPAP